MFNNELNTNAQMVLRYMILILWTAKECSEKSRYGLFIRMMMGGYVYSLADFTAQQGVRDTTDIIEKYRKGALGALPNPELINALLSIKGNAKGDDADDK